VHNGLAPSFYASLIQKAKKYYLEELINTNKDCPDHQLKRWSDIKFSFHLFIAFQMMS